MNRQYLKDTEGNTIRIQNVIPTIGQGQQPAPTEEPIVLLLKNGKFVKVNGGFVGVPISAFAGNKLMWDATEPNTVISDGYPDWGYFRTIKMVALNNAGDEVQDIADFSNPVVDPTLTDGSIGQVMVRFPRLYYREHYLEENGWLTGIELSQHPLPGLDLHPLFTWGNGRNFIYIGAYEGTEPETGFLSSVSGHIPRTNISMATFRNRAVARGGGNQEESPWHQYSYWHEHFLNMLFYVYYGNLNSQAVLPGYTQKSGWDTAFMRNTGRSNILTDMNGSIEADFTPETGIDLDIESGWSGSERYIANRFLFVENIYGHIWKFLDGCSFDGRIGHKKTAYIANDPRIFSSVENTIINTYEDMDVDLFSASDLTYIKALGKALLPVEGAANSITYYSDYFWSYLGDAANRNYLRSVHSGGSLLSGAGAGVACRNAYVGLSNASASGGSRLCFSQI